MNGNEVNLIMKSNYILGEAAVLKQSPLWLTNVSKVQSHYKKRYVFIICSVTVQKTLESRSEDTLILCVYDSIINRPPFKHPLSVPLRNAVAASRKCVVSAFAGLVRALISSIHPSSIDPGEMTRRALLARAQGTANNIHEQTSLGYCKASSTEKQRM